MAAPHPVERGPRVIELPTLREDRMPGAGLIRRAVTILVAILSFMLVAALVASVLVTVDMTIGASGVLASWRVWPVRSQETGTVIEVLVATGDTVAQGQPLARLDTLQVAAALSELRAQMAAMRTEYARSRITRGLEERRVEERIRQAEAGRIRARVGLRQRLVDNGFPDNVDSIILEYRIGTHASIDLAVADLLAAESEVRANAAERDGFVVGALEMEKQRAGMHGLASQISTLETHRARLVVRSPGPGIVLTDDLDRVTGSLVREGDGLMLVGQLGGWSAILGISEQDVHEVRVGDPVRIDVLAFPRDRDPLQGRVVLVGEQPGLSEGSPGVRPGAYRVVVAIAPETLNEDLHELRQGYTVRGKIIYRSGTVANLLWRRVMHR